VALRQASSTLYPAIASVELTDEVRVLDNKRTAARVRVLIEWSIASAAGPP
jgi:hypothetical protein